MSTSSLTANRPRVASVGERPRSATGLQASECKELEKYAKYLFYKATQVIVQSRQGGKSFTESQPNPKNQSWFCLAINDNSEITHEARKASANVAILGHPLCIEISLKTSEGDSMVLENWVLTWRDSSDPNIRLNNTVYNHMGLLLKSLLCVTRSTPAYRLSRRQGPETFVICYRVYAGEPISSHLGNGYQTSGVGQVVTNVGTLQIRVDYRTQMTITPSCSSSGEIFTAGGNVNFTNYQHIGSQATNVSAYSGSGTLPIQVKSDHFFSDLLPSDASSGNWAGGNTDQPPIQQSTGFNLPANFNRIVGDEANQTSDESQEAMRIFASSPPDPTSPYFRRQAYPGPMSHPASRNPSQQPHYSSNESLGSGQARFYRPRSGTNQSLGSTNEEDSESREFNLKDSTDFKVGAFVKKSSSLKTPLNEVEDMNDPLMELFSVDDEKQSDDINSKKSSKENNDVKDRAPDAEQGNIQPAKESSSPMFIDKKLRSLAISDQKEGVSVSTAVAKRIDFAPKQDADSSVEQKDEKPLTGLASILKEPVDPFVLLDFKAPFSNKTSEDAKTDLGIFFKDVQKGREKQTVQLSTIEPSGVATDPLAATPLISENTNVNYGCETNSPVTRFSHQNENLEGQLQNLNDQLSSFEQNLEEYDDMLKNMETTSATSESESELN